MKKLEIKFSADCREAVVFGEFYTSPKIYVLDSDILFWAVSIVNDSVIDLDNVTGDKLNMVLEGLTLGACDWGK